MVVCKGRNETTALSARAVLCQISYSCWSYCYAFPSRDICAKFFNPYSSTPPPSISLACRHTGATTTTLVFHMSSPHLSRWLITFSVFCLIMDITRSDSKHFTCTLSRIPLMSFCLLKQSICMKAHVVEICYSVPFPI